MSDAGEFRIDNIVGRTEISARDAVMPGEFVFVPLRPKKTKEERAGRKHVARGAKQKLTRRWFLSAEIHDAKTTKHHARSGAAKNSEQGKVLKIDDGKRDRVNGSAQFAECKVSAERAKQREESAAGKKQACGIDQAREAALFDVRDRVKAGMLSGCRFRSWRLLRCRRNRNVDEHLRILRGALICRTADSDGEREVVIWSERFGNGN